MADNGVEKLVNFLSQPSLCDRQIAVIDVQGMTCHSCVNNIQDNLLGRDGIHKAVVSLKDKEGISFSITKFLVVYVENANY